MFNKLIANLPFNPSLINQVAFYSKRLRRETAIRRMGFVFVALTFFVQMFAVFAPPEPSLAASGNDVIYGGFSSISAAANNCKSDTQDFRKILQHFGITCENIELGTTVQLGRGDYNGQLYSMGRHRASRGWDKEIQIDGAGTLYMGKTQDRWRATSFKAIALTNSAGAQFYLLYDCGNLVTVGPPTIPPPVEPPPPPPTPVRVIACNLLSMSLPDGGTVKAGSLVSVRGRAAGRNVAADESVSMYYEMTNKDTGARIGFVQEAQGVEFSENGPGDLRYASDPTWRRFTIENPGVYQFKLSVKYDSASKDAIFNGINHCQKTITAEKEDVCPELPGDQDSSDQCEVCPISGDNNEELCLILSKKATNDTQNIDDANGKVAQPGDQVTYTLTATNKNKKTYKDFVVEEPIADVLEYADIVDFHGGRLEILNDVQMVVWPETDIPANGNIDKQLTIKIKDPLPATNTPASDPASFDMLMTNIYGNKIDIPLPPPPSKRVEQTVGALPNTGPAENLAAAVLLTTFVGYFFARSRLMRKELDIVRSEYDAGGIA